MPGIFKSNLNLASQSLTFSVVPTGEVDSKIIKLFCEITGAILCTAFLKYFSSGTLFFLKGVGTEIIKTSEG